MEAGWGGAGENYRLSRIAPDTLTRTVIRQPEPDESAPMWSLPEPVRTIPWFEFVLVAAGVFGIGISIWSYVATGGVSSTLLMSFLALFPLLIVIAVLTRIDRWEPEPWWTKGIAFIWGAGIATVTASIINTAMLTNIALVTGDQEGAQVLTAVTVAPVAEESFKGLGVIFLVLARKNAINSIIDGVVYAGFIGAGFAFVENIQYFLLASTQGTAQLTATVILRGIFSPFIHPMATSFIGIGVAWALIGTRRLILRCMSVPVGWGIAVFVHGLWNFFGSLGAASWFQLYLFIEVPLFAAWLVSLLIASRREGQIIHSGLMPYVKTGWILPAEVNMISSSGRRRAALQWAKTGGKASHQAMKRFIRGLAVLGLDQNIHARIGPQTARIDHDRQVLSQLIRDRQMFLQLTAQAANQLRY